MASKRKRQSSKVAAKKRKSPAKCSPEAPVTEPSTRTSVIQDSLLLALPNELLTRILLLLLVPEDGSTIVLRSANDRRWHKEIHALIIPEWLDRRTWPHYHESYHKVASRAPSSRSPLLNCLLTCRDFYFAGVAALYGGNILKFDSTADLLQLMRTLDIDRRRHISGVMIERDICDDKGEEMVAGKWNEQHDLDPLADAVKRLPALKKVILDFKMGGGAPFAFGRLQSQMAFLRKNIDVAQAKVSFAIDGKAFDDVNGWAWSKKSETVDKAEE